MVAEKEKKAATRTKMRLDDGQTPQKVLPRGK